MIKYTNFLPYKPLSDEIPYDAVIMKIASFTTFEEVKYNQRLPFRAWQTLQSLIQKEAIQWAIKNSYGGLYHKFILKKLPDNFATLCEVELYVHVNEEIRTYAILKYDYQIA